MYLTPFIQTLIYEIIYVYKKYAFVNNYIIKFMKGFFMDKKKMNNKEKAEDATKYGEFVSSYFGWISPKIQKDRVEEMENIENNIKQQKNKKIKDKERKNI